LERTRFEYAPRDSFEEYASWKTDSRLKSMQQGDACIWMGGSDPDLLKGFDLDLIATAARTYGKHFEPISKLIGINSVQWLLVAPPIQSWAERVFPDLKPNDAESKLWEAVIKACRLDQLDPVGYWKEYLDQLEIRAKFLTKRGYQALRFIAPGTDLTVGLPENHVWLGGWDRSQNDIQFCGNLPTEELFTLPNREKVEGTVRATKPLNYEGNLIDDFQLTFSQGKVVDFSADVGEKILEGLLDTDPNARFLGEVALVPHLSPISQQNLVFLNTLYDENASNHLALGNAYRVNLSGGSEMSDEEFSEAGGNLSLIHEDFMFGSGEMEVDGILEGGKSEPIMRAGEWAFGI